MRKKINSEKEQKRRRRHMHIRNRLKGTPERPRVAVFRSSKHIYAQLVDDTTGRTIASVSSLKLNAKPAQAASASKDDGGDGKKKKKGKKAAPAGGKVLQAREVGRLLAAVAQEKGIKKIAFDRGGYLYHGRVAALADSAREHGLEF